MFFLQLTFIVIPPVNIPNRRYPDGRSRQIRADVVPLSDYSFHHGLNYNLKPLNLFGDLGLESVRLLTDFSGDLPVEPDPE